MDIDSGEREEGLSIELQALTHLREGKGKKVPLMRATALFKKGEKVAAASRRGEAVPQWRRGRGFPFGAKRTKGGLGIQRKKVT